MANELKINNEPVKLFLTHDVLSLSLYIHIYIYVNRVQSHYQLWWWNAGFSDADASNPTLLCVADGSHQRHQMNPVVIWALTSWCWYTARRVSMCIQRCLFKCSLPNRRSLDASFHQPVEVEGEHDEGNGGLVLRKQSHSLNPSC